MAQIIHVGSGSGEKRANVIFLHGLGGDPRTTWQSGTNRQTFWPGWLAEDVPGLAVYSIGYEAPVSQWRGTAMHLIDLANNLLARILAEPQVQSEQLILIGHSLGGLVIKQLLRTAESEARHSVNAAKLIERVKKVAFLATPHAGSDLASIGNRLRILAQPSLLTSGMVQNDPHLRDLNHWYRSWANATGVTHLILTETEATRALGMIVEPDSSDPGLLGATPTPIAANHWTICKPLNRTSDTYVLARNFIDGKSRQTVPTRDTKVDPSPNLGRQDALPDEVTVGLIASLGESAAAHAEHAGVSLQTVFQLAQRLGVDVNDFDQAMLELERAVAVAVEVAEEGRRGSNAGDFVDAVLTRIADKSAAGLFEEAAAEADTAFTEWEREETERRDAAIAGGLKLLDAGLKQDILRRDPVSAARRIQRMVELEHPADRAVRFAALRKRQDEWYESGCEKGLNFDLLVSIEAARLVLASADGSDEAGSALDDLGLSLTELGQRESDAARLEQAVEAFRAALLERTRERLPRQWATTQNNLGGALFRLGERESGTARLEQAVEAYRSALLERDRERSPLNWAATQNNLGAVLLRLGERESGTARLEEAVAACRAALLERTRERVPLDWAMTQNNIGVALSLLGDRESSKAGLEEAVEAFRAALLERTRERVPLDWAATQNNLGEALRRLGDRESGTARLEEAVEACRAALLERTRERVPLEWGTTQNNLGNALSRLGERESGTARLEEAVEAYRAASLERTRERVPLEWAMTQNNLGNALRTLGERESGAARLEEAVEACRAALLERTRERVPLQWATTQNNLGSALGIIGERQSGTARLEEAVEAFRAALLERTRERAPYFHDRTQENLARAVMVLERRRKEGAG